MKTNLFKSLLVAVMAIGAMGGVNSVKAETVTTLSFDDANNPTLTLDGQNGNRGSANYDYKFNESTFLNVWGENNSNGSKIASINTENLIADDIQWTIEFDWAGYSGCNKNAGYTQIRDLKGNSFLSFDDAADWGNTFSISSGGTLSCYPCNRSNRGSAATGSVLTAEYWHHIKIVGNITGIKLYVQKYEKNGTLNKSYIIDGALVNNENITPGSIALRPGSMGSVAIDNLVLSKETVKFKTADYTIFYKSGDNEIKTKETRTSIVNTNATISDLDKSTFYNEDGTKKYIYVSDDAASKTIAEDGSTVVTIQFREAAKYKYTVKNNINNYAVSGTVFEGDNAKVAFSQYILKDGVLYETNKIDNGRKEFNWTFAVNEDNTVKTLKYNKTTINNVAYYSEGENIDGLTIINSGNSAIRSSNSASAYAKDADVVFTTLPAGKYKLTSSICDFNGKKASAEFSYKAGEKVIFTHKAEAINSHTKTSEEFTLNESTPISLVKGGNDKQGIDFIYIQRTGDATETVSVSEAGFATYATTNNVVVPEDENVKVMTVKVNAAGTAIELNEVKANTVIPAGTGILVKADQGNHNFVVTSDKGEALAKNDLKAATADEASDGSTYFALTKIGDKVGFALVENGIVIPAGKAYLEVTKSTGAKFFGLDGEATGINSVKTAKADGAYYTLEGVKTTKPVKGLYIHNGKKIVVK